MISLVSAAVFAHQKHERHTICFDTIGGYSRKYSIISIPHADETSRITGELLEQLEGRPVTSKVDFVLKCEAGKEMELVRPFGDSIKTVKTRYTASRDINVPGIMHYDSYLKATGTVFVCNL